MPRRYHPVQFDNLKSARLGLPALERRIPNNGNVITGNNGGCPAGTHLYRPTGPEKHIACLRNTVGGSGSGSSGGAGSVINNIVCPTGTHFFGPTAAQIAARMRFPARCV